MNAVMHATPLSFTDLRPTPDDILGDTIAGLSTSPKTLPSKYFYDAVGSKLFEDITRLPEYYLTRVELGLMQARMGDIAQAIGAGVHVVEYGSGSGRKTHLLLDGLDDVVAYTPIEISRSALLAATARLADAHPGIEMLPVCADFTQPVELPEPAREAHRTLLFFPGSTLGNFAHDDAVRLLSAMRETMGARGLALIGVDLDKDPAIIEAAYNDSAGTTRAFTLNLLARLNREIGSDFDLDAFEHRAVYEQSRRRVETFLVSNGAQTVRVGERAFDFAAGEAMQVEYSCKYTDDDVAALAARAGLRVVDGWNDARDWFGLRLLAPA